MKSATLKKTIYANFLRDIYGNECKLIYFDGRKQKTIDWGYILNSVVAEIILISSVPVYICERLSGGKFELPINNINEFETVVIYSMDRFQTCEMFESDDDKNFVNLDDAQ